MQVRGAALMAAMMLAGCSLGAADVFDMPVADASAKLAAVSYDGQSRIFYGSMPIQASRVGSNRVNWISDNGSAHYECAIDLAAPEGEPGQTHVAVSCKGGGAGDGAAAGMAGNMFRNAIIEMVDSTLRDRAFDASLAGSTAARWPADPGAGDTSLKGAIADAARMDRETRDLVEASGEDAPQEEVQQDEAAQ